MGGENRSGKKIHWAAGPVPVRLRLGTLQKHNKMIDFHTSEKTLEVLKRDPKAIGILKALKPNREISYDEIESRNGMFLYYRASSGMAVFLYRDVTHEEALDIAKDFDHNLFVPYEVFNNNGESKMKYIEEWRQRDEASAPFRKELNSILYCVPNPKRASVDPEVARQIEEAKPGDEIEAEFFFDGSKSFIGHNIPGAVGKMLKDVENECGIKAGKIQLFKNLNSFLLKAPVEFVRLLIKHEGIKSVMPNEYNDHENNQ